MSYFPTDIPFMSEEELKANGIKVNCSEKPNNSKLKPCPFCGGEARLLLNAKRKIYGKDEYRTGVVACCNVCEARMFYGSEKLAIEAWNRRAENENVLCKPVGSHEIV